MVRIVMGERIGRQGELRVGCTACIFDAARASVLLTRRADNGRWCLPGGHMEPGETLAECLEREVWEETGLRVEAGRLIGVYSNPHLLLVYPDGNRTQVVGVVFEANVVGGALGLSDETVEVGYFTAQQIADLDVLEHHRERIADAFASGEAPVVHQNA
jgi:8-oxo-dGTP pyrophosphatase MutT (NUDIX family)